MHDNDQEPDEDGFRPGRTPKHGMLALFFLLAPGLVMVCFGPQVGGSFTGMNQKPSPPLIRGWIGDWIGYLCVIAIPLSGILSAYNLAQLLVPRTQSSSRLRSETVAMTLALCFLCIPAVISLMFVGCMVGMMTFSR